MEVERKRHIDIIPVLVLAIFWLGLLVGVSFIATPIKFSAPTLSLPVALDVGSVTFGLFSRIEWLAAVALAATVTLLRVSWPIRFATLIVIVVVAAQAVWLLPILDARIEAVIAGAPQPHSHHHSSYAVLEAIKAAALIAVGALAIRALIAQNPSRSIAGETDDRAAYPR